MWVPESSSTAVAFPRPMQPSGSSLAARDLCVVGPNPSAIVKTEIVPLFPSLDAIALQEVIVAAQLELQSRAVRAAEETKKKVQGIIAKAIEEFRPILERGNVNDWEKLKPLNSDSQVYASDVREAILEGLAPQFIKAMITASNPPLDPRTSLGYRFTDHTGVDAICKVLTGTPLFLQGVAACIKEYADHRQYACDQYGTDGIVRMLKEDKDSEKMIELRSKAIGAVLTKCQPHEFIDVIGTGPTRFLSHGEDAFDFPDYKEMRKAFIGKFQDCCSSASHTAWMILQRTPKQLPADAIEIFGKAIGKESNVSIHAHIKACKNDEIHKTLFKGIDTSRWPG